MPLLTLLLLLIVAGLAVVVDALRWVALGLFLLWALGWVLRRSGRRWYLW